MQYRRVQALDRIREFLAAQRQGRETTCQTAARLGIFCRGYDKWNLEELRALYPWLASQLPLDTSREEFLELVAAWDEARMLNLEVQTTCDAKTMDREGCLGFETFENEQLKRLFPQLFAVDDEIVG